ncbi:unnamed protein product, partial [marine sediment metagenome]
MAGEGIVNDLNDFYSELVEYSNLASKDAKHWLTVEEQRRGAELNRILGRKIGYLGALISELSGMRSVNIEGSKSDMWSVTLKLPFDPFVVSASLICVQATNRAIGKLVYDITKGTRDKLTGESTPQKTTKQKVIKVPPKVFIVHGGKSGVLDKLCEFVEALGIKPLVVEMLPSKGMTLANKVKKYQQEADCAIILATRGGIIDIKSGKQHPRLNVIDELSSFWEAFPERVILLLEKGVELPSNKAGVAYEPFARQSMDRAFTA